MASWFDDNAPGRVRPRTPGYQAPASNAGTATTSNEAGDVQYEPALTALYQQYFYRPPTAEEVRAHSANLARGTGTLSDIQQELQREAARLGLKPPTTAPGATPPARTAENNPGLDPAKWLAGHKSPKYLWIEAQKMFDQKTEAGRAATLAYVQKVAPEFFNGWTIAGDKLRYGGDLNNLNAKFDGYNEFDAWQGSKVGNWGAQWLPTQRYGQAYLPEGAAPTAAAPGGSSATAPASGPASLSATPAVGAAPVGSASPMAPSAGGGAPGGYGVESGDGFGALMQPWEWEFAFPYFQAPTGAEVFDDPGYQFRQEQGQKAIERSAAAQGTVLNPATVKALQDYNSGLASQEYGNVYNRRLGEQGRAHDQAFNAYTTAYNVFNRNQDVPFNRLAAIAGLGQTSAGQLGAAGSAFGANYGNTIMQGTGAQADWLGQGANAQAAGRVGSANAWNNALGNTANGLGQSYYNWQAMNPSRPPSAPPPNFPGRWW